MTNNLKIMIDNSKYCPECAGLMLYNSTNRCLICSSCGLSLKHYEFYIYWRRIKDQDREYMDDYQRNKARRKEWLDWYKKSRDEKANY